jgi:arylsulfatase A-like enzyme
MLKINLPWQQSAFLLAGLLACIPHHAQAESQTATKPNIVFILVDDLGYGDVHCLNPDRCKIATPFLDKLASQGMTLRDAHTTSAVCTPSRYGILTGRYNWRSTQQKGVLSGYSEPLIAANRLTVAGLLKQNGYTTAAMGKWHLGMEISKNPKEVKVGEGPTTRGFDYFYGISASLDMPPYAFIENDHFTEAPTAIKDFKRKGAAAPSFEAENVVPTLVKKADEFITKTKSPFFLYLALPSPHTPLVPTKEWQGKSGLGEYGDYVMETDWAVGQVMASLEKAGVAENTLVIFSSDNGVAPYVGVGDEELKQLAEHGFNKKEEEKGGQSKFKELEAMGHFSSGDFRGHKSDIWDGGHRVPTLVRWPAKIEPSSKSEQLVSLVDFMATCADIVGAKIPENSGEDSVSMLPLLLGKTNAPVHEAVVFHSINGSFGIQQGNWKLELCAGSGGWGHPNQKESKGLPAVQLYDMSKDIGERTNEQSSYPEIVARLTKLLEKYVAEGRSTPGQKQQNDAQINLWKDKGGKNAPDNGDSEAN